MLIDGENENGNAGAEGAGTGTGSGGTPPQGQGQGQQGAQGADKKGANQGASGGQGDGANEQSWRDALAGGSADVKKFLETFTDPAQAGKWLLDTRKHLSTAIVPPGKDATPEQIAAYRKRLDVPDTADGYELKVPDGAPEPDPERAKSVAGKFAAVAHKHNIPRAAFADLVGAAYELVASEMGARQQARETERQVAEAALRQEWPGKDYDANVAFARGAVRTYGGDEFAHFAENAVVIDPADAPLLAAAGIKGVALGNHPQMLRFGAKVGRATGEERMEFLSMDDSQRNSMQGEYDTLTRDYNEAMRVGDEAKAEQLYQKRDAIARKLYGNAPIIGSAGRVV